MNGAKSAALERREALAALAHHLHQMLPHLRYAQHFNVTYQLDIHLPKESEIVEAIGKAAKLAKPRGAA